MTTVIDGVDGFKELVGTQLGYSEWMPITQERVNLFADATDDHQWIHVDPERAKDGPFGVAIAHGYLTLSLAPVLLNKVIRVDNTKFGVNYGCNKVRFPSPVPVGAELRMGVTIAAVDETDGGVQVTYDLVMEVKDAPEARVRGPSGLPLLPLSAAGVTPFRLTPARLSPDADADH